MTMTTAIIDIEASDTQAGTLVFTVTVGDCVIPIPLDTERAALFAHKFATAYLTAFGDSLPLILQAAQIRDELGQLLKNIKEL